MIFDTITYALDDDGVALITLNRPDVMNALTQQMRAEIREAVTQGGREGKCVVLTGAGERAFCSGQDLGDRQGGTADLERTLRDEYTPMLEAIVHCPVPIIAAVNGVAAGAGANIALSADIVIAAERAYFLQAFARIGLIPDAGGTYLMPRTMGMAKAMGAALFADKISARQADDWGMIWAAIPDTEFDAHWRARAAQLATGPTMAYQAIKRTIRGTWEQTYEEQLAQEASEQGKCGNSRDFMEGVLAFTEKRKAQFEGR